MLHLKVQLESIGKNFIRVLVNLQSNSVSIWKCLWSETKNEMQQLSNLNFMWRLKKKVKMEKSELKISGICSVFVRRGNEHNRCFHNPLWYKCRRCVELNLDFNMVESFQYFVNRVVGLQTRNLLIHHGLNLTDVKFQNVNESNAYSYFSLLTNMKQTQNFSL